MEERERKGSPANPHISIAKNKVRKLQEEELDFFLQIIRYYFPILQEAAVRVAAAAAAEDVAVAVAAAGRSGRRREKDLGSEGAAFAARRDTTGRAVHRMNFEGPFSLNSSLIFSCVKRVGFSLAFDTPLF